MIRKFVGLALLATLAVTVDTSVATAEAESAVICRGEERGWFLNEGSRLLVYYYPQTSPATAFWKQNWYVWWQNNPQVTLNIWCAASSAGPWRLLTTTSVDPYYRSQPLYLGQGVYCFEYASYRADAIVYLKIR